MPRCWRRGSTAPAVGSVSGRAARLRSTPASSTRRCKKAISWRCSDRLRAAGRHVLRRGGGGRVARERRLEAKDVEAIFRAFAEVMRELPPDIEAGWLDTAGDLRLAPD